MDARGARWHRWAAEALGDRMARKKSPEERAAELEERKRKLEEQLKQERQRAKKKERERDTRRKVLVGAKVLEHARTDPRAARYLRKIYDELGERERQAFEGFDFPDPQTRDQGDGSG